MLLADYCIQSNKCVGSTCIVLRSSYGNYNNIYTFGYFMWDGHVVRIPGQWPHQGYWLCCVLSSDNIAKVKMPQNNKILAYWNLSFCATISDCCQKNVIVGSLC